MKFLTGFKLIDGTKEAKGTDGLKHALFRDASYNGLGDHKDERIEKNPENVRVMDVSDCPAIKVQFRQYSYEMDDMFEDLRAESVIFEQSHYSIEELSAYF